MDSAERVTQARRGPSRVRCPRVAGGGRLAGCSAARADRRGRLGGVRPGGPVGHASRGGRGGTRQVRVGQFHRGQAALPARGAGGVVPGRVRNRGLDMVSPEEVTVDTLRLQIEHLLYGAVTATRAVLPAMLRSGAGTLLFTTGGGAINPYPMLASMNMAQAALRNWVHNLHATLAGQRVHAATVAINLLPATTAPEGVPHAAPDGIAQAY